MLLSLFFTALYLSYSFVVLAMTSALSAGAVEDYEDFLFDT
jgi:hypothetical protein